MTETSNIILSLFALCAVRGTAVLIYSNRYFMENRTRYGILTIAWLIYAIGPAVGIMQSIETGDSNHPVFGYSVAVGTLLLMLGIIVYFWKISYFILGIIFSIFMVGFGILLVFFPSFSGQMAVMVQLLMLAGTLAIVLFRRKWLISISGPNSFLWLCLFLVLALLHAVSFRFSLLDAPLAWRFMMTFLTNLLLLVFFLHFDREKSFRELKESETRLKATLAEKGTLLREVQHRVKNNLQVMISLMKIQQARQKDQAIKAVLQENIGRVYSMSAIHESLSDSENLSSIDFDIFIQKMTRMLSTVFLIDHHRIQFKLDIPSARLDIHTANPLGMVLNELVTNALLHAFPGDRQGTVWIAMQVGEIGETRVTVKDDGIGFPEDIDWRETEGMGLFIARDIVKNQLEGTISMEGAGETRFVIQF